MRNNEWGKTLLYVYKYLERVTDSIDKLVSRTALNYFITIVEVGVRTAF